jgi:hypothetical protein
LGHIDGGVVGRVVGDVLVFEDRIAVYIQDGRICLLQFVAHGETSLVVRRIG